MELYNFFQIGFFISSMTSKDIRVIMSTAAIIAASVLVVMFLLQGIGLYTMARKRGFKKKALAFVPFANVYYMGKLAGECTFFGRKIKNVGLYAMIAQIVAVLLSVSYVFSTWYLYYNFGLPLQEETLLGLPYWPGASAGSFSSFVQSFYQYASSFLSILGLVSRIFMIILVMGLFKRYAPGGYRGLGLLCFFLPEARFIVVFVLRNRPVVDFEAYMRKKREEFMRRQQQYYNTYGNPYGNPYNRYGQGNSYPSNGGQSSPKEEDPFSEFSSSNKGTENGTNDGKNGDGTSDGFFD